MKLLRTLPVTLLLSLFFFGTAKAQPFTRSNINEVMTGKVCDSSVTSNWTGSAWIIQSYQIYKLDANGYVSNMHIRNDAKKISYAIDIERNASHKATLQSIGVLQFDGHDGFFEPVGNYYYFYNTKGHISRDVNSFPDLEDETVFDSAYDNRYTYDANNFLTLAINRRMDYSEKWVNQSRSTYTNNSSGFPLRVIIENYKESNSTWETKSRLTNTYDVKNNLLTSIEEDASDSSGTYTWHNKSKTTNTYNSSYLPLTILNQTWSGSAWVNSTLDSMFTNKVLTYTWDVDHWKLSSKKECSIKTSISAMKNVDLLTVYPNPANNQITLNTEGLKGSFTMTISNTLGERMLVQPVSDLSGRLNVNVSQLSPGLYNVTLQNQSSVHTARIIIAR